MRVTATPGFQPGLPYVGLVWYASTDCTGQAIGAGPSRTTQSTSWTRIAVPNTIAPSGAQSARIDLISGPTGDAGSSVGMQFDGAFFGPSGTVPVELQSFSVD